MFDWSVLFFIQDNLRCPALDVILRGFSAIGEMGMCWIAGGILMLISKKYRRNSFVLFAGLIAGVLVCNLVLKNLVARPRPFWLKEIENFAGYNYADYSFPSGHAVAASISSVVFFKTNKRFGIAAIVLTAIMCFSRVYLFVHFPTDVLAGIAIGVAVGELVWFIFKKTGFLDKPLNIGIFKGKKS